MRSEKTSVAGKNICKQNNTQLKAKCCFKNMKRFADEQEPVVGVPLIVEPVIVEDALVRITVQHRDITIVVVHREGTAPILYRKPSRSPPALREGRGEFYLGYLARQLLIPSIFSLWTNRRALPTGVSSSARRTARHSSKTDLSRFRPPEALTADCFVYYPYCILTKTKGPAQHINPSCGLCIDEAPELSAQESERYSVPSVQESKYYLRTNRNRQPEPHPPSNQPPSKMRS